MAQTCFLGMHRWLADPTVRHKLARMQQAYAQYHSQENFAAVFRRDLRRRTSQGRIMSTPISAIVIDWEPRGDVGRFVLVHCNGPMNCSLFDLFSTDRTIGIAQACGAKKHRASLSGYCSAAEFRPNSRRKNDWVLFIDADEVVSPALQHSIHTLAMADTLSSL